MPTSPWVLVAAILVAGLPNPPASAPAPAIAWHACQLDPADEVGAALDRAGVECGRLGVPVDYRRPGWRTISVAVYRKRATDPAQRRGVLMINPGGPGVPGLEQVLLGDFMPDVARRYDLVAIDPRFVGRSTPLHCRWNTDTFLRSAGPDRHSFAESVELARELAAGCDERDLLPFASTRNTARDLDAVRAALGEAKLSYLGVSYGTYLGAVYLQLFGGHADRFVLDSAVDPDTFGPGLIVHNGPAVAAALRHWAMWTAAHHDRYGLGATTDAVLSTIDTLDRVADRRPLPVGRFQVDGHVLPYLLFAHLYDDSEPAYATLATDVRSLVDASPNPELDQFLTNLFTGSGPATDRAGTPILCADRAVSRDPRSYLDDIEAHRRDEPLFGPLTRNVTPCAFWPVAPAEPATAIANARPALLVGADGDPAAPRPGQQAMHRALTGSRMVTLAGAFRHGVFLTAGNPCVDAAVTGYLVTGRLPNADTTC